MDSLSISKTELQEAKHLLKKYFARKIITKNKKENIKYVMDIVRKIISHVGEKPSSPFTSHPVYIGSAYSGVKVGEADDFDLLVTLKQNGPKRSSKPKQFSFTTEGQRYYKLNMYGPDTKVTPLYDAEIVAGPALKTPPLAHGFVQALNRYPADELDKLIFEGSEDVVPFLARRELKKLLAEAVAIHDLQGTVKVESTMNGPAITLDIYKGGSITSARVGFSPAITRIHQDGFPAECGWPRAGKRWPTSDLVSSIKRNFPPVAVARTPYYWLNSYAEAEKALLRRGDTDGGGRRKAHMIMKKLNKDLWSKDDDANIDSYTLKTIFLWECERFPESSDWTKDNLWIRIISMTEDLVKRLERPPQRRHLAHYFDERINLLKYGDDCDEITKTNNALTNIKLFLADRINLLRTLI